MSQLLQVGIPAGSLQESAVGLFRKAGYRLTLGDRSYIPEIDDEEIGCVLIRAQEMARYVANGALDFGITGLDWIQESGAHVIELCELQFSRSSHRPVRWVLCVPKDSPISSPHDLNGKRIATELVKVTEDYFTKREIDVSVEFSWGATEAKPPILVDAIVEATETGTSLRANNLKIIDEILTSTPRVIANPKAYADIWKKKKSDDIVLMLQGALAAQGKVGLMMNVRRTDLQKVIDILPALQRPTVSTLSDAAWVDVMTITDESIVRSIIPRLKDAGATGIVEFPITKIID